jgi:hypothetical protein
MAVIKIHSQRVILVEGYADEFVPNVEPAAGMQGFAITVPPGERGEWLLDMLWRITMAYAGMPSLLMSPATVRKMVEAVMGKECREHKLPHIPSGTSGLLDRTHSDRSARSSPIAAPASVPSATSKRVAKKAKFQPAPQGRSKAKTRHTS